jgi:hypothetical protein
MKKTFYSNPTKRQLILVISLTLIGNTLLILSSTNLFKEPFFQSKYLMIYFLMMGSIVATLKLVSNYRTNQ